MTQLIQFQTGDMHFVIDPEQIAVVDPQTSDASCGPDSHPPPTIRHQGRSYRLVDLSAASGPGEVRPYASGAKVVVVKGSSLALWADRIGGTVSAAKADIEALPGIMTNSSGACFSNVLGMEDRLALVVDRTALSRLEQIVNPAVPSEPPPSTEPEDAAPLEHMVMDTLERFIGRRVKRALERTIAENLGQRRARV